MKWQKISLLCLFTAFFSFAATAQQAETKDLEQKAREAQKELNEFYKNSDKSPLEAKDKRKFKGHEFYPVSSKYIVTAKLVKDSASQSFRLKTTTDRLPEYKRYAVAYFELNNEPCSLELYQSVAKGPIPAYNPLFLPFKDLTNGENTYELGRYLNIEPPSGDEVVIDFNQSYYPYCAYSDRYSCPLVPQPNHLNLAVEAGIKGIPKKKN